MRRGASQHQIRRVLANRWAVLEAVPRSAANEPHVVVCGMAVDQEIAVGGVFILADACLDDGRTLHRRKPPLDPCTRAGNCAGVGRPIGTVGIDRRAMLVDPDFHAAVLHVGDAVYPSRTIDPRWCGPRAEAFVAGRPAKVDDVLTRRPNETVERRAEDRRQPGPAGEDEGVAVHAGAVGEEQRLHRTR